MFKISVLSSFFFKQLLTQHSVSLVAFKSLSLAVLGMLRVMVGAAGPSLAVMMPGH